MSKDFQIIQLTIDEEILKKQVVASVISSWRGCGRSLSGITRTVHRRTADGDGGVREELASGLSDVLFMQQIIRKANPGH